MRPFVIIYVRKGFIMKIWLFVFYFCTIPAIGLAHSGTLLNAASNYMPFLVPLFALAVVSSKRLWNYFKSFFTKK